MAPFLCATHAWQFFCTPASASAPAPCCCSSQDGLVHECAIVISVYAEHRKRQVGRGDGHGFDNQRLIAHRHGNALGPATVDVGQHQAVNEVAIGLGATAVLDHVDLKESWRRIAPV